MYWKRQCLGNEKHQSALHKQLWVKGLDVFVDMAAVDPGNVSTGLSRTVNVYCPRMLFLSIQLKAILYKTEHCSDVDSKVLLSAVTSPWELLL